MTGGPDGYRERNRGEKSKSIKDNLAHVDGFFHADLFDLPSVGVQSIVAGLKSVKLEFAEAVGVLLLIHARPLQGDADPLSALAALEQLSGDKGLEEAVHIFIEDMGLGIQLGEIDLQTLVRNLLFHLSRLHGIELDGACGAGVGAAGHSGRHAGVQNVGTHGTLLRRAGLLIPVDSAIRAGGYQILHILGLLHVDEHHAVLPAGDALGVGLLAGGVLTVLAGRGQVGHVYAGELSPLRALDIHPAVSMAGLRPGIGHPVVVHMLVLAGHKAVVAVVTQGDVDYHIALFHY